MVDVASHGAWAELAPRPICRHVGVANRQPPQRTLSSPAFDRGTSRSSAFGFDERFPTIDSWSQLPSSARLSSASSTSRRSKPPWNSNTLPERSDRSIERLREEAIRPSSASSTGRRPKPPCSTSSAVRENSRDRALKQNLPHARRHVQKQEEIHTCHEKLQDLSDRLRLVTLQLQEETRARKEQELIARKLERDLQEAQLQLTLLSATECADTSAPRSVGSNCSSRHALDAATRPRCANTDEVSSATTLRSEHERLREKERDQRRRRRLAQPRQVPLDEVEGYQEMGASSCEASEALAQALAQIHTARVEETEAREVARAALDENRNLRRQLEVFRSELQSEHNAPCELNQQTSHEHCGADTRLQNLTKVANEIALQADLRQLEHLASQATELFESEEI